MLGIWKVWISVLWKNDHIWLYYSILLILFVSNFFFLPNERLNLIPFYGLFISVLTLLILTIHHRFGMGSIIRVRFVRPHYESINRLLFSLFCSLPVVPLLFIHVKILYVYTPNLLLLTIIMIFLFIDVAFSFFCSLLPFNYAIIVNVFVYVTLILMQGYRLERFLYVAPTLNFMYPDNPNIYNMLALVALSLLFFTLYIVFANDWERKYKKWLSLLSVTVIFFYLFIPFRHWQLETAVASAPFEQLEVEKVSVYYKGISEQQAIRYGQVVTEIVAQIRQHGVEVNLDGIEIVWQREIPSGVALEHIVQKKGTMLLLQPYSQKFFEFNYGYNIVRDVLTLFVEDAQLYQEIEKQILLDNKNGFFTPIKVRSVVQ